MISKTSDVGRKNRLFLILCCFFLTNAILAEIVGTKIFSAEALFGFPPAQLPILDFHMDFNLTAGVLIWPIVFIISDLINEYFGKPGVRQISFLTAGFIAYVYLIIWVSIRLPPAIWWIENYKNANPSIDIDYAFDKILGQGQRIILGSLVAFLVGQFLDVFVFHYLRKITGPRWLWIRATGSTLFSQFIDSFLVLYIAFYGVFSSRQIIAIGITNYIYKFVASILLTPLLYVGHYFINRYLGKDVAKDLAEQAAARSLLGRTKNRV